MYLKIFFLFILFCGGYMANSFSSQDNKNHLYILKENIDLFQDGEKIGELYKGAKLTYDGGTEEGFQRAILYLNYNEKPDSLKYYILKSTHKKNIIIPCWNNKDVELPE
jgi:hypothetical protein